MFRVVTVAREYGSGGAQIAQLLADHLDWKLLDRCLIEKSWVSMGDWLGTSST